MEKRQRIRNYLASLIIFVLVFTVFSACEKTNTSGHNPPADHSISEDGFMHKNGLDQALTNCTSCHGSDLQGGSTGVSCYECHNKKWE